MSRRGWIVIGAVTGVWLLLLAAIGVVTAGALGALGGGQDYPEEAVTGEGGKKVAVIRITEEIHGGEGSGGTTDVIGQLRQAAEDDDVEALVLRLNTPGGAVVASDEIYRAVARMEVPVVASMGNIATSGGYYIASAAEEIVANQASLTGSIGVIMVVPNLQEAAEKLGVGAAVIKSGEFKDAGSPLRDLTERERELFQRLIDESFGQFVDAIVEGREMDREEVLDIADGRVLSGRQAMDAGLVDTFGDLETAYDAALDLAKLDREEARLVEYTIPQGFGGFFPPFFRSPVEETKEELGLGFGLKYLYLP